MKARFAAAVAAASALIASQAAPATMPTRVTPAQPATTPEDTCPRIESYLRVRGIRSPQVSPDGQRLIYRTATTGPMQIWRVAVRPNAKLAWPEQLTFGGGVGFALWSPRRDWIVHGFDEEFFLMRPDGTQLRSLLTFDDGHDRRRISWSPAGDRIAYSSSNPSGRGFDVFVLDVGDDGRALGEPRMMLGDGGNLYVEAWRPDGKAAVVTRDRGPSDNDLFLLDLTTVHVDRLFIPEEMAWYRSIAWLPDGSGFYLSTNHDRDIAGLAFYDAGSPRLRWIEGPPWDVEDVALSNNGRYLAWTTNEAGFSRVHLRDLASDRALSSPDLPAGRIEALQWAAQVPRLLIEISAPGVPGDAWIYDAAERVAFRATSSSLQGIPLEAFVVPEAVSFPSWDEETIHGLLYLPRRATGRRPPVVLKLHGGQASQARPDFSQITQYLAGRGYAILDLNVRGSTGYGKRFTHLNNGRLRPNSFGDLEAAAKWLRAHPDLDASRLAVMGASGGAYLTLVAVTMFPEYFAAGVPMFGMANLITALADPPPALANLDLVEWGDITDPQDREFFRSISPIRYADRVRAPLLFVHGARDRAVPVSESDDMVARLRELGKEVEYLRFSDEGHGISRLGNRISAYSHIARFLDRTIGGPDMPCESGLN